MKFQGNGIVWDAKNNRRLIKFENGVHETDDKHVIDQLIAAGYAHEGAPNIEIPAGDPRIIELPAHVSKKEPTHKPVKKPKE